MIVIGLTGGIASGKSTAAEMLRGLGAAVIDADRLGHRSYEPGTRGFEKVVNAFGHDIVGKDGLIDRRVLGGKVFGAPEQMERLNSIVWPEIRALIQDEIKQIRAQDSSTVIVLEAAVLLEAKWQDLCDEIWVVLTPVATAVDRLRNRNGLSEDAAMARINSQMSNEERAAAAQVTIENAGTEDELRERVEAAWDALQARVSPGKKQPARKTTSRAASKPAAKAKAPAAKPARKPAAAAAKAKPTARGTAKSAPSAARPAAKAAPKSASRAAAKPAAAKTTSSQSASSKSAASKSATKPAAKAAPKVTSKKAAAPAKAAAKTAGAAKAAPKKAAGSTAKAATAKKVAAAPRATGKAAAGKATTKAATAKASGAKSSAKPSAGTARPKAAAARKPAASTRTVAKKAPAGAARATRRAGARTK